MRIDPYVPDPAMEEFALAQVDFILKLERLIDTAKNYKANTSDLEELLRMAKEIGVPLIPNPGDS